MTKTRKFRKPAITLALLIAAEAPSVAQAQSSPAANNPAQQTTTEQSSFYCNINALSPAARAHHQQLTAKLIAARKQIVESPKGYEFQFNPSTISLANLADWAAAESKCCPFLDFHIDLEERGNLLCLRLTGQEGIKPFIRQEFKVPK
jgi:hypothetical protein